MQDHRTAPWPAGIALPGTPEHEHQRRLVLELAVMPPVAGDREADLARVLALTPAELAAAGAALVAAGLAERRGDRLFASPATRALEALWPVGA